MPNLETVDELAEFLADRLGVYGACKSDGENGCTYDEFEPFCCRVGFMEGVSCRIKKAVENDQFLESRTSPREVEELRKENAERIIKSFEEICEKYDGHEYRLPSDIPNARREMVEAIQKGGG